MVKVRLENLTKRFGKVVAISKVNLTIRDGEFIVLLGPSGCGKTTTLRCIAGLEIPDEGKVFFGDQDVTLLPPKDRNVSMVFQSYAVWPHMSVFDNIAFPLKIKNVPESEVKKRVEWAAELLKIKELLNRYPHQLSGGQRQRVAVARAIVIEPAVLLMDEPLSNLDALLRVMMRSELKKLQRKIKVTTIYVTHDQVEAMTMADRIAVMNQGKIMQVGTSDEIYNKPSNLFVAGFIGSPRMNFFDATIAEKEDKILIEAQDFTIALEEKYRSILAEYLNKTVTVGIRPEHMYIEKHMIPTDIKPWKIKGKIDFVEPLGSDTILHVNTGSMLILVKVPGSYRAKIGEEVEVVLDLNQLHIFDKKSEKALF
ncbi:MAG: sugar ABC transporter ATP-binding protein [Thermoprotei archaeon]|nr:MAG: sugar ABC transporter ATP-binding protein [Thermoprotei archaeon]